MSADNDNKLIMKPIRRKSSRSAATYLTWLVMLLIAIVGGAIVLSVTGGPRAPRTSVERDLAVFEQQVKDRPKDSAAQAGMGAALMQAGSYQRAAEHLNTAIKIEPKPEYGVALAEAYEAMGRTKDALTTLHALQKEHEDFDLAWFGEAKLLYDKGQYAKSVEPFMRSLALEPGASDVHYFFGHALEELGEREDAVYQYREALKFLPDYEEALEGLKRLGAKPLEPETPGASH